MKPWGHGFVSFGSVALAEMFESPPTVGHGGASVALLAAGAMEESARAELARLRTSRVPRLKT